MILKTILIIPLLCISGVALITLRMCSTLLQEAGFLTAKSGRADDDDDDGDNNDEMIKW